MKWHTICVPRRGHRRGFTGFRKPLRAATFSGGKDICAHRATGHWVHGGGHAAEPDIAGGRARRSVRRHSGAQRDDVDDGTDDHQHGADDYHDHDAGHDQHHHHHHGPDNDGARERTGWLGARDRARASHSRGWHARHSGAEPDVGESACDNGWQGTPPWKPFQERPAAGNAGVADHQRQRSCGPVTPCILGPGCQHQAETADDLDDRNATGGGAQRWAGGRPPSGGHPTRAAVRHRGADHRTPRHHRLLTHQCRQIGLEVILPPADDHGRILRTAVRHRAGDLVATAPGPVLAGVTSSDRRRLRRSGRFGSASPFPALAARCAQDRIERLGEITASPEEQNGRWHTPTAAYAGHQWPQAPPRTDVLDDTGDISDSDDGIAGRIGAEDAAPAPEMDEYPEASRVRHGPRGRVESRDVEVLRSRPSRRTGDSARRADPLRVPVRICEDHEGQRSRPAVKRR